MATRWPVGGIRTFFRYVYTQASLGDCRVRLLAPDDNLPADLGRYLPDETFQVRTTANDGMALGRAIRRELRRRPYDLLHSHGLTAGVLGQLARFGTGVPHLLTVHDVFLPTMFEGIRGRLKKLALARVLAGVDAVHAVSDDCAGNFREYMMGFPPQRVYAIANGIDTERFSRAPPVDIRAHYRLPPETALIGFLGRFMAQKGFRTLVDAVGLLRARDPLRPLRVLTFGWGGFVREDYAYLQSRGLGELFIQHPHTDEPEQWMKGLDVIAMPSRWEACGLLAMEALAAGVPIVGTDCIGLREVLAGSPARVVPPADAQALADALAQELRDTRTDDFRAYSATAVDRFSAARNAQALRALYGEIPGRAA